MTTIDDQQLPTTDDRPVRETLKETAARLGITENAVLLRVRRGTLPGIKADGRWWVLIDEHRPPTTSDNHQRPTTNNHQQPPIEVPYRVTPAELEHAIERTGDKYVADMRAMFDQVAAIYEGRLEDKDAVIVVERDARIRAEAERDYLQARVAALETKPAAQVMGELAIRPAFVPITSTPAADTEALEAERDALRSRVSELEAESAAAAAVLSSAPQRGEKRAWWAFWRTQDA